MLTYPDPGPIIVAMGSTKELRQRIRITADESIPTVTASGSEVVVHNADGTILATDNTPTWDAVDGALVSTLAGPVSADLTQTEAAYVLFKAEIDGAQVQSRRRMIIVPREARPSLLSSELKDRHAELADLRTDAELILDIAEAWIQLRGDLQDVGIVLDLLTDAEWIARLHRPLAASKAFAKAGEDFGDDGNLERSKALYKVYEKLKAESAPYDSDANDVEDTKRAQPADDNNFWRRGRMS